MPVLAVVFPRNESESSTWSINGIAKVLLLVSLQLIYDRTSAKGSKR